MSDASDLSPYKPGYGKRPPFLAGRATALKRINNAITRLSELRESDNDILLTGPRGCGKTVLLNEFSDLARKQDVRIRTLPDSGFPADGTALALEIRKNPVKRSLSASAEAGASFIGRFLGRTTLSQEPFDKPHPVLREAIIELADGNPLAFVVDETHEAPHELLRDLFRTVQFLSGTHPVMIIAAGTPDTRMHMRTARITFTERITRLNIGSLSEADAILAISRPIEDRDKSIDPETAAEAAAIGQCYPYFLQYIGDTLWDAASDAGSATIDNRLLQDSLPLIRTSMESLYADRTSSLRDHRLLPAAAELSLAAGPGNDPRPGHVDSLLGDLVRYWKNEGVPPPLGLAADDLDSSARHLLLHTCYVWQPDPGTENLWSFAIPSLASHVEATAISTIAQILDTTDSAPALQALVDAPHSRTRSELVADAVESLDGDDRTNTDKASSLIEALEGIGAIGPSATRDDDGNHLLRLLTPRLAARALEAL